jgi:DNA-directed RNA polymerase specialized sigma24 family protein
MESFERFRPVIASSETEATESGGYSFQTTRWTLVSQAGAANSEIAREALETLCKWYHKPLLRFAGRFAIQNRWPPEDAEDLTQGFISKLLQEQGIQRFVPRGAKFRSFLCRGLKNFLLEDLRRRNAAIRGSGAPHVSLQDTQGESRYGLPDTPAAEECIFDKDWAMTILDRAFNRLKHECEAQGPDKLQLFRRLQPRLLDESDACFYEQVARESCKEPSAIKTAHSRMRAGLRVAVREEIAQTVSSPNEIDEEISYLLSALAR